MISLDMIPIDEKVCIINILFLQFLISLWGIVFHIVFSQETLMHTIIWKNQVNKFHDKLSEGFAVIIRNIKVSALTGDYRPVQSNFKITFLRKTAIQKLQVDIFYIPQNCFKFIQPEIIHSSINKHILLSGIFIPFIYVRRCVQRIQWIIPLLTYRCRWMLMRNWWCRKCGFKTAEARHTHSYRSVIFLTHLRSYSFILKFQN